MSWWRVDLTLGPYTWAIDKDDAADPDDPGPLGELSFGWSMPAGDVYPVQPDPMDASVGVIVADVGELDQLDVGSDVTIEISVDPAGPVVFEFGGRITDLTVDPHARGVLVGVTALDYTVDERLVGGVAWPSEDADTRLGRIFSGIGLEDPDLFPGSDRPNSPQIGAAPDVVARDAAPSPFPAVLDALLHALVWDSAVYDGALSRAILAPGPGHTFCLDELPDRHDAPLPAEFGPTDDGYGVTWPAADPANLFLSAEFVERSARWTRRKTDAVNRVDVTYGTSGGSVVTAGGTAVPVISARVETPLVDQVDAQAVADYYLPESGGTDRWMIETLVYRMSKDLDLGTLDAGDVAPGWMPVHSAAEGDPARTLCYRRPVAILDIPEHQNPARGSTYAGQLQNVRLTITGGELILGIEARRTIPLPSDDVEQLTWAGLAAEFPTVTWSQLDTDDAWHSYRLVGEAA